MRAAAHIALAVACVWIRDGQRTSTSPATRDSAAPRSSPILFEANTGQFPDDVSFVVHGYEADLVLANDASLVTHSKRPDGSTCAASVELELPTHARPIGEHILPTRTNYFLGDDSARWRTGVSTYASVVYPPKDANGVSVRFHASEKASLEYDVRVPAHTNLDEVSVGIRGGEARVLGDAVVIRTPCGDIVQEAPKVFRGTSRRPVPAAYRLLSGNRIGFDIDVDDGEDLLIDPTLVFSTLLPGVDSGLAIANDNNGHVYVAGYTTQTTFQVVNAYQPSIDGQGDAWIAKFAADGSTMIYATYLGGSGTDAVTSMAVDASENVYLTGRASSDFPLVNAFQTTPASLFVAKLDSSGTSLQYSSFLGSAGFDSVYAIAIDSVGAAYIAGETTSSTFPTTTNAYQTTFGGFADGFISKVNAAGTALEYSTFLGGPAFDFIGSLVVDSTGHAYAAGRAQSGFPTYNAAQSSFGGGNSDAFVTKLSSDGTTLVYSTYLGGSDLEYATSLALDGDDDAYVVGTTQSTNFPIKSAYQAISHGGSDGFVAQYDASGNVITSTYLGGSSSDGAVAVAVGSTGDVFVFGDTSSSNFPVNNAFQSTLSGFGDCFLSRFDSSISTLVSSTFLGGGGTDNANAISVDSANSVYLTGQASAGFPLWNAAFTTGAVFVTKMATLTIAPAAPTVSPLGHQTFLASDGSGTGFAFTLYSNSSGGAITTNGDYTAGPKGNVSDIVKLEDSTGTQAFAKIAIGPGVAIKPPAPSTPPGGTIAFAASGGNESGYVWSLPSNNSGASIAANTGEYVAGSTGNVVDTVRVDDPLGNSATAIIVIGLGVTIIPSAPSVPPNGAVGFSATGGSGDGYVWSVSKNASGATIDASSGAYKAGALGKTVDTVRVNDSLGNGALVNVSVGDGLAINPAGPKSPPRGSIVFIAIGGSGNDYTWHLDTNASGGSIEPKSGLYVAGAKGSVADVVTVTDAIGNTANINIDVGPVIEIVPALALVAPHDDVTFIASGGAGKAYEWSLSVDVSGGWIDKDSGLYEAGANEGTDHVHVRDELGNVADALVLVGGTDAGVGLPSSTGGCSCRSVTASRRDDETIAMIGLAAALALRRRRRGAS